MDESLSPDAWAAAARLIARWLEQRERLDTLVESLPKNLAGTSRARSQHLVFGVVRHYGRIDAALAKLIVHPPRSVTRAVLLIAGFELIEARDSSDEGAVAKIVHHAVEQTKSLASPAEARLVNAVVRKLAPLMAAPPPPKPAGAEALAEYFSHPLWLVRRWLVELGTEATRQLLEWNQQPATVFARWRARDSLPPDFLRPTKWPGFFELPGGHWREVEPLLAGGKLYLQDPATRLAVELLAPKAGETVLDLCAAPGGKSLLIADTIQTGKVVAVDMPEQPDRPGPRLERLKENLSRVHGVEVALVQADVLGNLARELHVNHGLPESYTAVLLDVPCSNTGVMRHRADVRWRLQEGDFKKHAGQQLALLHAAARLVAPEGRLVYSTCSIDPEENRGVIDEFLRSRAASTFKLMQKLESYPWSSPHDGAGAYLFKRISPSE